MTQRPIGQHPMSTPARPLTRRTALAGLLTGVLATSALGLAAPARAASMVDTGTATVSGSSGATVAAASVSAASVGSIASAVADDGGRVVKETVIDARTVDLTLSTPTVGAVMVRLLLPKDWATSPTLRWPTLYMFPGPDKEDYKAWTTYSDIKKTVAPDNVLIVLPSGGAAASYTDEYSFFMRNPPRWETFHTTELPQIIQRGYRSNGVNAVAGISAGGFGALAYTFRHPGLYKVTAAYSAPTDLFDPAAKIAQLANRINAGTLENPWGPLLLNIPNQIAHNPINNAAKFKNQPLYISSGKGQPGPLDYIPSTYKDQAGGRIIEAASGEMAERFVAALKRAGAKPVVHIYPDGLHNWPYWNREFSLSYPMLKSYLGGPTTAVVPAGTVPTTTVPARSKGLLGGLLGGLFG